MRWPQESSVHWGRRVAEFQQAHRRWVDDSLTRERTAREGRWSEAVAVGNLNFVEKVKSELGFKAAHRKVIEAVWHICAPGAKRSLRVQFYG